MEVSYLELITYHNLCGAIELFIQGLCPTIECQYLRVTMRHRNMPQADIPLNGLFPNVMGWITAQEMKLVYKYKDSTQLSPEQNHEKVLMLLHLKN